MPHAVARLRDERLAKSLKPFVARGSRAPRCLRCRVPFSHCLCPWLPRVDSECGVCLLMHDIEPLKPSNTGWLIADVVPDTMAFGWARTETDPALLALLADPQWQPYVVFPGEFVAPERVITQLLPAIPAAVSSAGSDAGAALSGTAKRPLFILLDATWPEARKIFKKSSYLLPFPVLSLEPEQVSRYQLRRSRRDDHLCTSEVAALCLALAGETLAAQTLEAYLDVFTGHYLCAKQQWKIDHEDAAHQRLRALMAQAAAL